MKIRVTNITENPTSLLRRAGYVFQRSEHGEMSFVRPLARSGYPRFHAYVKTEKTDLLVNFHLDQKKETYGTETRHHGEYENDGPLAAEAKELLRRLGPNAGIIG
jgi:formamidopyrimidine-DNA glycosylase